MTNLGSEEGLSSCYKRPIRTFPKIGEYEVMCGDFHMHTTRSDGLLSPRDRVLERWKSGFDVIAITDHHQPEYEADAAHDDALPTANSLGMVLLRGFEAAMYCSVVGNEHYVVLGVSSDYKFRDEAWYRVPFGHWRDSPEEGNAYYRNRMREVEKNGGLLIYAHPHRGIRENTEWGIRDGIIQGVEVCNETVRWCDEFPEIREFYGAIESHGTWCYPFAFDWALEHNLAIFANSDIHVPEGKNYDSATLVLVEERSEEGVMNAIRDRRTIAWFSGMLWGRAQLLSSLVRDLVDIRHIDDGTTSQLLFRNNGPIGMRAKLRMQDVRIGTVEIGPYQEVIIEYDNPSTSLSIVWENIWTSPRDNLETTHDIGSCDHDAS